MPRIKIARTLAKEANVKLAVLNPLEGLTNSQIEKGENYLTVMRQNLQALVKAGSKQPSTKQENTQSKPKTVYNGYFNDEQIKNRSLKDWQGTWQSVYPLVAKGELDQVFHYKAKLNPKKTAEDYRAYYEKGYRTDVKQIEIQGDTFTFTFDDGSKQSSDYRYVGYKVLNYEAGNRASDIFLRLKIYKPKPLNIYSLVIMLFHHKKLAISTYTLVTSLKKPY